MSSLIQKCLVSIHFEMRMAGAYLIHQGNRYFFRTLQLETNVKRTYRQPRLKKRQINVSDVNFRFLFTPELIQLSEVFQRHDFELRIAGGAVRDLLSGKKPYDVDFATTATPNEMQKIFQTEGIRVLHDRGAAHGTLMVRINDCQNFEVTTSRFQVVTEGKEFKREFTRDWMLDASQRDLTVNAMFLTLDGTLHDFFQGEEDLKQNRVLFVGDANERIQEDYLRILRYFRFHGKLALDPESHDEETLDVIKQNRKGLSELSGERVWPELKKILSGENVCHLLCVMHQLDLLRYCGLPSDISAVDIELFKATCDRTSGLNPHPITLLSDFLKTQEAIDKMASRLKCVSKAEKGILTFMIQSRDKWRTGASVKCFQNLIVDELTSQEQERIKEQVLELLKYQGQSEWLEELQSWKPPVMPVTGFDLMVAGFAGGKHLKQNLVKLHNRWKESDFKMSKEELIQNLSQSHVINES